MNTFSEKLEREQQDGTEFKVGAILDSQDLALIPLAERMNWLPQGVLQRNNLMDTSGCASRSPIAILKAKFTYLYHHGMLPELKKWLEDNGYIKDGKVVFDETYIEILSGTTPQGNSLKAPLNAVRHFGLIPEMLPLEEGMTWEQYMDKNKITSAMYDLGKAWNQRFTINYEQVPESQFLIELEKDWLDVAANAWPKPIDGVYYSDNTFYNHAFAEINPEIDAFDSYPEYNPQTGILEGDDYIKRLDKKYKHFEWGYTISVTKQTVPTELPLSFWLWLPKFLEWLWGGKKNTMPELPKEILPTPDLTPVPETPAQRVANSAIAALDQDVTPDDIVPDEVACVTQLVHIVPAEFGLDINLKYTPKLFEALKKNPRFKPVLDPSVGTIVVSPTVGLNVGHCGVYVEANAIASNNSFGKNKGKWTVNYTRQSWRDYFIKQKGLKGYLFNPI